MSIRRLHAHGRRQHSLFTYAQAVEAGFSHEGIRRQLLRGAWQELEPLVFRALPAAPPTFEQRLHAKILSVGGVAFGRSSVALYKMMPSPRDAEVLVVRPGRNRSRPGLHSTRSLPPSEVTTVGGIPATMPGRSVIDACAALPPRQCNNLVDAAVVRRLVRPHGLLKRAIELNNSKRPGCAKVIRALASQHPGLDRARNEWEALVVRLAREFGLPAPVLNYPVVVGGQRRLLDVAWPEPKVDLEFDGFQSHMVRTAFDDDRVRQNALVDEEWKVFRATSQTLRDDPSTTFTQIATALDRRGHGSARMRAVS